MQLMLAFTNSSHHSKGTAVLTSKPWQIQPLTSSQCGYPVVTRLLQASLQVRKFQRQRLLVWKGDDKEETMGERMGKWLQHKETPFPVYGISNRWSQYGYYLQKQGTNLKGESSKGRWQEGGTRVCCRRTSEMMNLPQLTLPWRHLVYQPLDPGKEMGGRDFLHMFLIRPMHPVSTYSPASMHPEKVKQLVKSNNQEGLNSNKHESPWDEKKKKMSLLETGCLHAKNSLIFPKLSLETKMLNHCTILSLEYSREEWMSSGGLLIYCHMQLLSRWGNTWKQGENATPRWGGGELPKTCKGRLKVKKWNYTHRPLVLLQTTCFYKL